jgi:putative SOS response-associated peptidase YedK
MPSLVKHVPPDKTNIGTTNIRHAYFKDWEGYLGVEHRCLVPLTRFASRANSMTAAAETLGSR